MSAPVVSLVMPSYDHRKFVLGTLEPVLAQSFTGYEVIVVNDGSPDDTAGLLRPLVETGRIRYFEQENAGQPAARNRGLAECPGEFIAFLDDDDAWPADTLEWQVELLRTHAPAVGVGGQWADNPQRADPSARSSCSL
jgi:glycosyltransferase involved in cell wall biosynthesis